MGGMIAQTMALLHPERVRSLTSIMSTTGRRTVGWQDPRLLPLLLGAAAADPRGVRRRLGQVLGGHRLAGLPRHRAGRARPGRARPSTAGSAPAGVARQMLAILGQPDRTRAAARRSPCPTLVIHGLADKMVHVSGGRATARAIPGSELLLVPGMGHDLPDAARDASHASSADRRPGGSPGRAS